LREITLKAKASEQSQSMVESKKNIKESKIKSNLEFAPLPVELNVLQEHKDNYEEESSAMVD
jgi:hypothetical protein